MTSVVSDSDGALSVSMSDNTQSDKSYDDKDTLQWKKHHKGKVEKQKNGKASNDPYDETTFKDVSNDTR